MKILLNADWILPVESPPIKDGALAINNNIIEDIGNQKDLNAKYNNYEKIELKDKIILPGFINAHTHSAMVLFRGLADDLPLNIWLNDNIWPAEAKWVNPDFIKIGCSLAFIEMLRSGTTTLSDMYFFAETAIETALKIGIRIITGESAIDFPTPSCKTPEEALKKTEEIAKKYKDSKNVFPAVFVHSPYTCSSSLIKEAKSLANSLNIPYHIHLAETKWEFDEIKSKCNFTPVEYLNSLKVLDEKTSCAHSVWLNDNDISILSESKTSIVTCPVSNLKLGSGIARISDLLKNNVNVGLGTDSSASNNNLDILLEARILALLHKGINLEPTILPADQAIKIATLNSARAFSIDSSVGSLKPGKFADIISISINQPHNIPYYSPESSILYSSFGLDVSDVIINGKFIIKDKIFTEINTHEILYSAREFAKKIKSI